MNKDDLCEALAMEGLNPTVDDDGDIRFTYNDWTFFASFDRDDPDYVSLFSLFNLDAGMLDRQRAIAANLTKNFKAGKCVVFLKDSGAPVVRFSIEAFTTQEVFRKMLRRHLELLKQMVSEFFDEQNRQR